MYFVALAQRHRNVTSPGFQLEHQSLTSTYRKCLGYCASNKVIKSRPICVADLENTRPDQISITVFQIFISNRHDLHLHWSSRQLELHVELPVRPGKIMFTNPNCRNN